MSEGPQQQPGVRVTHLDELDRIDVAGVLWRPVRRPLDVTAFGVNAYSADATGDALIEEHDETGAGSGKHEELYIVLTGHATFELNGRQQDAPAGTFLFISDPTVRRSAVAASTRTTRGCTTSWPATSRWPATARGRSGTSSAPSSTRASASGSSRTATSTRSATTRASRMGDQDPAESGR
jgi:mannose-6-phosphate isomerase-like protein (cupin superfamily)